MNDEDKNALYEKPLELLTSVANTGGYRPHRPRVRVMAAEPELDQAPRLRSTSFPMPGNAVALPVEDAPGGDEYPVMVDALRDFLDAVASAELPPSDAEALARDLRSWTETLMPLAVPERERIFGRRADQHGRGQTMSPQFVVDALDDNQVSGRVTFGSYFLGGNGAVHGGAIPLLLDEILGRLSNSGGRLISRTAYLHTDYRSITPVDVELQAHAWFVSEEGRKRVLRGEIRNGDTLCAEAEGLFIALRPDQP